MHSFFNIDVAHVTMTLPILLLFEVGVLMDANTILGEIAHLFSSEENSMGLGLEGFGRRNECPVGY